MSRSGRSWRGGASRPGSGAVLRLGALLAALVVGGASRARASIGLAQEGPPNDSVFVTGAVDSAGTLDVTVRMVLRGNRARLMERLGDPGGPRTADAAVSFAQGLSFTGKVEGVVVQSAGESEGAYRLVFAASITDYLDPGRDEQMVSAPLPGFPLPDPPEGSDGGMLSLGLRHEVVHTSRVRLPRGLLVLPTAAAADSASFARFSAAPLEAGRELGEVQALSVLQGIVPKDAYDAYRAFSARVAAAAHRPLTVVREHLSEVPAVVRTGPDGFRLVRVEEGRASSGASGAEEAEGDSARVTAGDAADAGGDSAGASTTPGGSGDHDPALEHPATVRSLLDRAYPPLLRNLGIGGTVSLRLRVDDTGRVDEARVETSSGYNALDFAAARVALRVRFRPALRDGRPTGVWIVQPFKFGVRR